MAESGGQGVHVVVKGPSGTIIDRWVKGDFLFWFDAQGEWMSSVEEGVGVWNVTYSSTGYGLWDKEGGA
jgi:hypothetical protein